MRRDTGLSVFFMLVATKDLSRNWCESSHPTRAKTDVSRYLASAPGFSTHALVLLHTISFAEIRLSGTYFVYKVSAWTIRV